LLVVVGDDDLLGKELARLILITAEEAGVEKHTKRSRTVSDLVLTKGGKTLRVEAKLSRLVPAKNRDGPKYEFNFNPESADVFVYFFLPMIALGRTKEEYVNKEGRPVRLEDFVYRKEIGVRELSSFNSVEEILRCSKVLIFSKSDKSKGKKLSFYTSSRNQKRKTWHLALWINGDDRVGIQKRIRDVVAKAISELAE